MFTKQNINVKKLSKEDEDNLNNLRIIESYLNRGIDEHQKILTSYKDMFITVKDFNKLVEDIQNEISSMKNYYIKEIN